jgi:hypothetical protein
MEAELAGWDISSPQLRMLYEHWLALRGGRSMPAETEVDLADLPSHALPHVMLLDAQGRPESFRFRFLGPDAAAAFGDSLIGRCLGEIDFGAKRAQAFADFAQAKERQAPTIATEWFMTARGTQIGYELLLLPLAGRGGKVVALLGGLVLLTERPALEPPQKLRGGDAVTEEAVAA